jgi:hypothetical protein
MEIGVDTKREAAAAQKGVRNLLGGGEECTDVETIRCFYECVAQNMNAEECIAYIKDTIGEDLDCHEITELKIVVNTPRTPDVISATYWMFGIPVNVYGEVDCDIDGGIINYPWEWVAGGGIVYTIPPVSCIGLDADECCTTVLTTVSAAGIPLVDDNDSCFSCWVHQEPLEPIISEGTGELAYIEHRQGIDGTCEAIELTPARVTDADTAAETKISTTVAAIETILDAGTVTCSAFSYLQLELLLVGRAKPGAMSKIAGLLCGICSDVDMNYTITPGMTFTLHFIIEFLTKEPINSTDNCIVIYVDHQGLVMEPPKIGGSRSELDWDRDDPDCDEGPPSTGDCFAGQVLDPTSGECVCTLPLMSDGFDGCQCPPPLTQSPPGPFIQGVTTCACEGPEFVEENNGACVCNDGDLIFDPESESCICTGGRIPLDPPAFQSTTFPQLCVCEDPKKSYDSTNEECICNDLQFMDDPSNPEECKCTGGRTVDAQTGVCECPEEQIFDFASGECVCT